jgi:primosomal protein N' (replication factor Y)
VATQLGINRLEYEVDASVVVTADSLLAIPDLSAAERLFHLLLQIREKTRDTFIIQTRSQHTDIFEQAINGDVARFYRDQIQERENFSYPPFSYLIKLTASGKPQTVKKQMAKVRKLFADNILTVYPSARGRGYTAHALLQIKRDEWIDEELLQKLYSLPLSITINAHPRSLL